MLLKDKHCLESILQSIQKIKAYSQKYKSEKEFYNTTEYEASMMNFIIISEMVEKLSDETKLSNTDVQWKSIKGFRNIATHNYFGLDAEEVWSIIQTRLPDLQTKIKRILSKLS